MLLREIADLCGKRRDHVLRDIEKMLQDIAHPKFGVSDFLSSYIDSKGRSLKAYRLPKDLTVTLITGYGRTETTLPSQELPRADRQIIQFSRPDSKNMIF